MKRSVLAFLFAINMLPSTILLAQFDIQIDPAAALITKNIKAGFEVGIDDLFSIDANVTFSPSVTLPFTEIDFSEGKSYSYRIVGKFSPYPKYGMDAVYVGPYLKYRYSKSPIYTHTRIALGFMTGYKKMLPRKFYFEIGGGLGLRVYSSLKNNAGEFIDGLTGVNIFGGIYDYFSNTIGKYDLTTRLVLGYRISGNGPLTKKQKEAQIIRP